jgi:hypothetical protein
LTCFIPAVIRLSINFHGSALHHSLTPSDASTSQPPTSPFGVVIALRAAPRLPQQSDTQDIRMNTRMIDNEVKMMRQERVRLQHEREQMVEKIADNTTKIKQNKVLPYLVSKVVEVGWDDSSIGTCLIP